MLVDKSVSVIDQAVRAISKTIARALHSPTSLPSTNASMELSEQWQFRRFPGKLRLRCDFSSAMNVRVHRQMFL